MDFPISRWKSSINAHTPLRTNGLKYKKATSPFTGNYVYMTTNGKYFLNYYAAMQYQTLLNQGICPEKMMRKK
jgi:hypothetical protein